MLAIGSGDAVVAVVAHPDDAEILCYGTLRLAKAAGAETTVVIVSDGESGVSLADAPVKEIRENERVNETRAAFAGTGISVRTLGLRDGEIDAGRASVIAIEATLAELGCTILITHAVQHGNDHQDHHAVGRSALNAASRLPTCRAVLHGQPLAPAAQFTPNLLVDVTELMHDKVCALQAHETQNGRWYLGEEYTRHRAREHTWRFAPSRASQGLYFEAFEQRYAVVSGLPRPDGVVG